jgi:hypothetical protein
MAEIKLTAMYHDHGGPALPSSLGANLAPKAWPSGGTVKVLQIFIGDSKIEIWPADPYQMRLLSKKLWKLAGNIDGMRGGPDENEV